MTRAPLPSTLTPVQLEIERKLGIPPGTLTADALARWQLERVNETLAVCRAESRFYQHKLASFEKYFPLRNLNDLQQLPFTTAEDLRAHNTQMICLSQSQIARVVTLETSATTAKAKRVHFSAADQQLTIDFFSTGMSTLMAAGWRALILFPYETPGSIGDLLSQAIRQIGGIPVPLGAFTDPTAVCAAIAAAPIDTVVGAPKQVYALAKSWRQSQSSSSPVRSVLLSSDYAAPPLKAAIEQIWNCHVLEHYGMTEAGLGVGIECAQKNGYHLREADLFFELVNADGSPVRPGESGELVFTTLTRTGMPLIRYRTGDITRVLPTRCGCGTVLRTYDTIHTRITGRARTDDPVQPCPHTSIQRLDDLLFQESRLNGFDAAWDGARLSLDLYVENPLDPEIQSRVERLIQRAAPPLPEAIFHFLPGFPASAFSLQKKRIRKTTDKTGKFSELS